jgi:hypothetical protein
MKYEIQDPVSEAETNHNFIHPSLWTALSHEDEKDFRRVARLTYNVGERVNILWHPVYLHECYLMNKEAGILTPYRKPHDD